MTDKPRPRPGRPARFVRDRRGREIHGLSASATQNGQGTPKKLRYYATASSPRFWFGFDLDLAIMRFRAWEARQKEDAISIPYRETPDRIDKSLIENWAKRLDGKTMDFVDFSRMPIPEAIIRRIRFSFVDSKENPRRRIEVTLERGELERVEHLPAADLWPRIRELILDDPKEAAEKTGIRELAYLPNLKPPPPSAKLEEVGNLYRKDKEAAIGPKELANSKTWWDEFRKITGAKTVADLNREALRKYRQRIIDDQTRLKRSPVYVRSRFGKIKTIINYAIQEADLSPADLVTLELRTLLKPPSKPPPNPIDLTQQEVRAILRRASEWDRAMILTALNCAYYPKDISRLKWTMINFQNRTVRFDRAKASGRAKGPVPRVAVLWPRTCTALKKIRHDGEHVFISSYGLPASYDTIRRRWDDRCEAAKITRHLTFGNLRDTALTVAASSTDPVVPMQQYHVLAGHVAKGVDDNYIRRFPHFVADACEAIRRHFGL